MNSIEFRIVTEISMIFWCVDIPVAQDIRPPLFASIPQTAPFLEPYYGR